MNKKYTFTRVIRLQSLVEYIIKSWKKELIIAAIVMLVTIVYGTIKVGAEIRENQKQPAKVETKIELSEQQYLRIKNVYEYQKLMQEQQTYNDTSIAMNIDPNKKEGCFRSFFINNVSDEMKIDIHNQYLVLVDKTELYDYIVEKTQENIDSQYYAEALSLEDTANPNGVFFKIYHYDTEMLAKVCEAIDEYMEQKRQVIMQSGLTHDLEKTNTKLKEIDTNLVTFQKTNIDAFVTLSDAYSLRYEDLSSKEKKYLQLYGEAKAQPDYEEGQPLYMEVNTEKDATQFRIEKVFRYVKLGFVYGVVLGIIYGCWNYLYSSRMLDEKCMEDIFQVPLLANVNENSSEDEMIKSAAVIIELLERHMDKTNKILMLSNSQIKEENRIFVQLKESLKQRDKELYFKDMGDKELEIIANVNKADLILLLEEKSVSKLVEIAKKIDICKLCEKKIAGAIVLK